MQPAAGGAGPGPCQRPGYPVTGRAHQPFEYPAIVWLEEQLRDFSGALILITHDRRFLQNVANEIAELHRGRLTFWKGDYRGFLHFQQQQLDAEERTNELFDKKLAQEEVRIRQGIRARRTRNEGRVRALEAMRAERRQQRERLGTASFAVGGAGSSGKIVAELEQVSHSYDGRCTGIHRDQRPKEARWIAKATSCTATSSCFAAGQRRWYWSSCILWRDSPHSCRAPDST